MIVHAGRASGCRRLIGLVVLMSVVLSACGSSAGSQGARSSGTVTNSPTATQSTVKTVTEKVRTASSGSSSASRDPKCVPTDLGIHFAGGEGATAMLISTFQFINVSRHECHLLGYPGVALYDRGGRELHVKVGRGSFNGRRPLEVRLRRGGRASFMTITAAFSGSRRCFTAYHAHFTPPDDYSTLSIRVRLLICGGIAVSQVENSR
ncbi:MAG: DUF4232 domain-containing protein [Actinomycetota bacterium]|nr:DUF4232 domain-containing protein [Actinomycetota bacterium]